MDNKEYTDFIASWYANSKKNAIKKLNRTTRSFEDAEDIFQNMTVKLLSETNDPEDISFGFRQFTATADFYRGLKRHSNDVELTPELEPESDVNLEDEYFRVQFKTKLYDLLDKTDNNIPRKIFIKKNFEEKSFKEIAQELDLTEVYCQTTESRFRRTFLIKLKNLLTID